MNIKPVFELSVLLWKHADIKRVDIRISARLGYTFKVGSLP